MKIIANKTYRRTNLYLNGGERKGKAFAVYLRLALNPDRSLHLSVPWAAGGNALFCGGREGEATPFDQRHALIRAAAAELRSTWLHLLRRLFSTASTDFARLVEA